MFTVLRANPHLLGIGLDEGAALVVAGGVAYSIGGAVYALRRPDPLPATFGYHELFHVGTIIGFSCHYVAIALAVS